VDVSSDGALIARFTASLPSGAGSLGVPVGRGMRVAGGTLTMNGTFTDAAAAVGDEGTARAKAVGAYTRSLFIST